MTAVFVQRPILEEKWRVPFSNFLINTLVGMYVAKGGAADEAFDWAFEIARRMGFRFVSGPEGGVVSTEPYETNQQRRQDVGPARRIR